MSRVVRVPRRLDHGDRVRVEYRTSGEWSAAFVGTYLTRENLGDGPRSRIKRDDSGEHTHVSLRGDDVRAVRVEEVEDA